MSIKHRSIYHPSTCRCPQCSGPIRIRREPEPRFRSHPIICCILAVIAAYAFVTALLLGVF